jgi:Ca2+/Na+ antiporter
MAVQRPFLLYLRSRLNVAVAVASLAVLVAGLVLLRGRLLAVIGVAVALYAAVTVLLFFSRRGATAVVAEADADRASSIRRRLDEAAALRQRIAVLRLGDEELRRAVENFLLASGQYLEKARATGSWSPQANDRIRQVLEICQIYLGEKDESSTEKRYGTADGDEDADVRGRSIAAVRECAAAIRQHSLDDLGSLDGTEQLGLIEEMEGKK